MSKIQIAKRSTSGGNVVDLLQWLRQHGTGRSKVVLIRTSDKSKVDFEAQFRLAVALLPNDPDVQKLAEIGHAIVLPAGEKHRRALGAMELRRGSVPGGAGRALLGWLVPIGQTLFVLYLSTARCADIAGETPDQSKNAFTEALCEIVRQVRPATLHTPAIHRLVRNTDFGAQVVRTLRTHQVEVWAGGERLDLTGGEAQLLRMLDTWFAARDADGTVERLAGIEANMYADRTWYLTDRLLPFVWRARVTARTNPLTGEPETVIPDPHDIEVTPGSVPVFDELVVNLKNPELTLTEVGVAAGERGVRDRAPANFQAPKMLHELAQPGAAVASLIQRRWLKAYLTGRYSTQVRLKADLRKSNPALAEFVSHRPDGSLWLDVTVDLPLPERGYLLDQDDYDIVLAVRHGATPQRIGRAASSGDRRPLSSLSQWDDLDDRMQYRLGTFDSGKTYACLWRPLSEAYDSGGSLGWSREQRLNKTASVRADVLHQSIGDELLRAARALEGQLAALRQRPRPSPAAQQTEQARQDASREVERLEVRRKGIRAERQEARGRGDDAEVQQLNADEEDVKVQLAAAKAHLSRIGDTSQQVQEEPRERQEAVDLGTLERVGVLLKRVGPHAPAVLNDVLHRLFAGSLRVVPDAAGLSVTWAARLHLPLADGSLGQLEIGSAQALPALAFTRRAEGSSATPDWADLLAHEFFDNGRDLVDIGKSRGLNGSGKADTYLVKSLRRWLSEQGVTSSGLRSAALDAPAAVRLPLARLLRGHAPGSPYERRLIASYSAHAAWSVTWVADGGADGRRLLDVVEALGGDHVDALEATRRSGLTWRDVIEASAPRTPLWRGGPAAPGAVQRNWTRGNHPANGRLLGVHSCPHRDCLARADSPRGGTLLRLPVPELGPEYLLCRACRRTPGDASTVFPELYLLPWVGGRRTRELRDGLPIWVGSHLAA